MKQKNKIQLLLVAAFAGIGVMCYAQQGKMCKDVPGGYNIVSLQDPSDPSSYQWMEDGKDIPGATAAVYTVPADKAEGKYTYIRRSKKEGCEWASSNAYTVDVFTCGTITPDAPVGTKGSFQDPRDQKMYKTVKMPDGKVWMAENLNYQSGLTFNQQANQANGQPYTDNTTGIPAIGSYWCPPVSGASLSANKNTCNVYGALYTWETAMSPDGNGTWNEASVSSRYHDNSTAPAAAQNDPQVRGICPAGFHLPSDYEWANLLDAVDPAAEPDYSAQAISGWYGTDATAEAGDGAGAGVKMKSASTYLGADQGNGAWADLANRGNDKTGFGATPAGQRNGDGSVMVGRGTETYIWTSSVTSAIQAWPRNMGASSAMIQRAPAMRANARSARCVRD
jgi:uncharacterized protein (TIGR02145 family)